MKISLELVPRNPKQIAEELEFVVSKYPVITMVNFPDLLKLTIRSWEACRIIHPYKIKAMPHFRAKDFSLENMEGLCEILDEYKIFQVLVLGGDMPQDVRRIYPTATLDLIKAIKKHRPKIIVYGTLDPYRSSVIEERERVLRKRDAGVDGFFTQPFFDIRYMEIFKELLDGTEIFWGVSPVLSDNTKGYWETKNNIFFPKDFKCDIEWNAAFAKEALGFARESNTNIYFMPISTKIETYLSKVFDETNLLD
jgi:methylenetetrahydrofolate reductase (NADPH)